VTANKERRKRTTFKLSSICLPVNSDQASGKRCVLVFSSKLQIQRFEKPFPVLIADEFFEKKIYRSLMTEFDNVLARGLWEGASNRPEKVFWRSSTYSSRVARYDDMFTYHAKPELNALQKSFFSREFFLWIRKAFPIPVMPDFSCAFHHHVAGSKSGVPHTDFTIEAWRPLPLQDHLSQCDFNISPTSLSHGKVKIGARAIALIYYLNNPKWSPSMGGETFIFNSEKPSDIALKIAPLDNRLLAFEISPRSWHSFRRNIRSDRSSIVLFLYVAPQFQEKKFKCSPV